MQKEVSRQKQLYFEQLEKNQGKDVITPGGKILKKKIVPKKKVTDEKGDQWEVVDQKKTVVVEESASDGASGLSDSD